MLNINYPTIRFLVFLHDIAMIPIAWALAYWLRFNLGAVNPIFFKQALYVLPIIILVQTLFYGLFGLHRGIWRFASLPDLIRIFKAVGTGIVSTVIILFLTAQLFNIPRSIFPLYGLLLVVFLGGSRIAYRLFKNYAETKTHNAQAQRVLIVGAGQAGEGIARDLLRHTQTSVSKWRNAHQKEYKVIAFVDDSQNKIGQEIHGIRVLGKIQDIPKLVSEHAINLIMIAIPSSVSAQMRRIVQYCEQANVPFRTLPGIQDLASGHVQIDALRAVSLEDLLGRDPVSLDWDTIRATIENKCILVSGGGGSIGAELCRQIAKFSPKKLIVIEQNEFNLYSLALEFEKKMPMLNFFGHLLDVTDSVGVQAVLQKNSIDMIFHAAAYKHVPLLEHQQRIAVRNNILGTKVLAEEAARAGVQKFILISTDKAVNPSNIMGATKRVAEIFCQNYSLNASTPSHEQISQQQNSCQFITVRFGNVLGSTGSVIPLFKQQIESGGPVTVTHPDITRFFMTIPEASQLILQATLMGNGGEIFVLDMGEPIKISYLAEQMIRLAGFTPGQDIAIEYTGLRPGEKLYEELFHAAESLESTPHEKIMKAKYRPTDWKRFMEIFQELEMACQKNNDAALLDCLRRLVPEFQPT